VAGKAVSASQVLGRTQASWVSRTQAQGLGIQAQGLQIMHPGGEDQTWPLPTVESWQCRPRFPWQQ
jgi:hypothetical protein